MFSRFLRDIDEMMESSERKRRASIGPLGRLREDAAEVLLIAFGLIVSIAITFAPWAIGLYVMTKWLLTFTIDT